MDDAFVTPLLVPISETRLDSYGTEYDNRQTRLSNYLWNIELSQAFYPLLQAFEVSFRNAVHHALCEHKQDERWFEDDTFMLHDQISKVEEAKDTLSRRGKPPTTGRIVAQLTFGFWTSLLNRPYEERVWHVGKPIVLLSAFPYLPKQRRTRKSMYGRAQLANTLRNRIFHYEPIWNRLSLLAEHDKILDALGWISPEMGRVVEFYDSFPEVYQRGPDQSHAGLLAYLDSRSIQT